MPGRSSSPWPGLACSISSGWCGREADTVQAPQEEVDDRLRPGPRRGHSRAYRPLRWSLRTPPVRDLRGSCRRAASSLATRSGRPEHARESSPSLRCLPPLGPPTRPLVDRARVAPPKRDEPRVEPTDPVATPRSAMNFDFRSLFGLGSTRGRNALPLRSGTPGRGGHAAPRGHRADGTKATTVPKATRKARARRRTRMAGASRRRNRVQHR